MDTRKVGYCSRCSKRDTCTKLCPPAAAYVNQDYVKQREIPWTEINPDVRLEDLYLKNPWGSGYVSDNNSWISLIKKLNLYKIKLTNNQKKYLYLYYIKKLSQRNIANRYSVSQQSVCKTLAAAKLKLRNVR